MPTLSIANVDESRWTFLESGEVLLLLKVLVTKSGEWRDQEFELNVSCGESSLCAESTTFEFGNGQQTVSVHTTVRVEPGIASLRFVLTASGREGDGAELADARLEVESPELEGPRMQIISHELLSREPDGTAAIELKMSIPKSVLDLRANGTVRCLGDIECSDSGSLSIDQTREEGSLRVELPHGEKEIYLEISEATSNGVEIVHAHERYAVNVPEAEPPSIGYVGFDLNDYNDDGTANLIVKFAAKGGGAWPYANLAIGISCVDEATCTGQDSAFIDWDQLVVDGSYRFSVQLNGVRTGDVSFDATFNATGANWLRPRQNGLLEGIELAVEAQPGFDLRWTVHDTDNLGYFMDGSALIRLESQAINVGHAEGVSFGVDRVCLKVGVVLSECWDSGVAVTMAPGAETAIVSLGDFKMPQGSNELIVEVGDSSSTIAVEVEPKIVGLTRDMWECFADSELVNWTTCGGFTGNRIRKWELKQVKVYREGDPEYVRIFDDSLLNMGEVLGIEYVIVDDFESAHIEAYVGHVEHPRVIAQTSRGCAEAPGCARGWSTTNSDLFDGGFMSVRERKPEWRDEAISLEDEIRYTIIHELSHIIIPTGHDSRPFSPFRLIKPYYIRESDFAMYRMIYSPLVRAGMTYDEVKEVVVFAEDTFDYDPERDADIDVLVQKTRDRLQAAGALNVKMSGSRRCGREREMEERDLTVWYWDFKESRSTHFLVEHGGRSAIGFDFQHEVWYSPGSNWRLMGDDRRFFDWIDFDPYHADPNVFLWRGLRLADDYTLSLRADGLYVLRAFQIDEPSWPQISLEIYLDRETGEMSEFKAEWDFGPGHRGCPYYIDAEVLSYGKPPEIPPEVANDSVYLTSQPVSLADEVIALGELHASIEAVSGEKYLGWRCGDGVEGNLMLKSSVYAIGSDRVPFSRHRLHGESVIIVGTESFFVREGSEWVPLEDPSLLQIGPVTGDELLRLLGASPAMALTSGYNPDTSVLEPNVRVRDPNTDESARAHRLMLRHVTIEGIPPSTAFFFYEPLSKSLFWMRLVVDSGRFPSVPCELWMSFTKVSEVGEQVNPVLADLLPSNVAPVAIAEVPGTTSEESDEELTDIDGLLRMVNAQIGDAQAYELFIDLSWRCGDDAEFTGTAIYDSIFVYDNDGEFMFSRHIIGTEDVVITGQGESYAYREGIWKRTEKFPQIIAEKQAPDDFLAWLALGFRDLASVEYSASSSVVMEDVGVYWGRLHSEVLTREAVLRGVSIGDGMPTEIRIQHHKDAGVFGYRLRRDRDMGNSAGCDLKLATYEFLAVEASDRTTSPVPENVRAGG